ncbi:MAG TPA: S41 family peptidase [Bryobacteraceae bacterium]|nr:S41 family peptidase [Bryobacteraceae bacterium]
MLAYAAFLLLFADEGGMSIEQALKSFTSVFAAAEANAADPINPNSAVFEGAVPGMLKRLDPFSVFFDPGQFEQLKELEKSTRKGFGSVVSLLPGRVIVLQTLPGTPSARSGMNPGDEIVSLNGIPLNRLDTDQLLQLLSQSRNQQVQLMVRRPGNVRLLPLTLTPEEVDTPSVERAFQIRPGVAYLRVGSFDVPTGKAVRDAIEQLGGANLKGLVLDLRNNPGGVMGAALETASLFLKPGQVIVSVRGRSVGAEEIKVPEGITSYTFPVSILVNNKTASASEIVAGALQDHKRATILGEQSFGKGLVQSVLPMSHGTGVALTTAFYYTPGGRSIQRSLPGQLAQTTTGGGTGGIQPDQVVFPEGMTRLRAVLDATGSFTTFATDYTQRIRPLPQPFDVTPGILDEFQAMLSARNIRPGLAEWSREREWIQNRLKQEILNQGVGVAKGDEVELERDPVALAALAAMGLR